MAENKPNQVADGNYIAQADRGGIASINIVHEVARLSPSDRRNRSLMIKKVRDFWVHDVLHDSLYKAVLIDLGMEYKPYEVTYPWKSFFKETKVEIRTEIPISTTVENIFDEQNGELLILGTPGSGKTTTLLHLAEILLNRAESNETLPIPVVFNLSSWTEQKIEFDNWVMEELNIRYGVPNKIAQGWVKKDNILLLLDGLDEVEQIRREKCVEAINEYRSKHGFTNVVVCSRIADYDFLETKLKLQAAILIQALTLEQIDSYLENLGNSLSSLRQIIKVDTELQNLAQSPLLLNIMVMAYLGGEEKHVITDNNSQDKQTELLSAYVTKMFSRRSEQTLYSSRDTVRWLAWLAKQMQSQGQTVFFLESLQSTWLEAKWQQISYSLAINFIIKAMMALMWGLYVGLPFGLVPGSVAAVIAILIFGYRKNSKIQTVDTLKWSWPNVREAIKPSLVFSFKSIGIIFFVSLFTGFIASRFFGITLIALFIGNTAFNSLTSGLVGNEIEVKSSPNQGIQRSLYNSIIGAIVYAFWGGGASLVLFPVVKNPGMTMFYSALLGFVSGWMRNGGLTYIQHYSIRFLLWRNGNTPLNFINFLDYGVDRIFLRRVGGGYIFIHRLPMEYFASLGKETDRDIEPNLLQKMKLLFLSFRKTISFFAVVFVILGLALLLISILDFLLQGF